MYADQAGANKLKALAAIEDVVPLPNAFKMSPEVRRGGRIGDTHKYCVLCAVCGVRCAVCIYC